MRVCGRYVFDALVKEITGNYKFYEQMGLRARWLNVNTRGGRWTAVERVVDD